jgi:hypothetical protein
MWWQTQDISSIYKTAELNLFKRIQIQFKKSNRQTKLGGCIISALWQLRSIFMLKKPQAVKDVSERKRLPALEPCLLIVMASVQCLLSGAPGRTPQSTPCQLGVWHPRGVYGDALVLVVDAIGRGALPITLDTSPHDAAGRARQGGRAPRREGRAGARWAGGWCWGRSVRQGEARGGGGGGGREEERVNQGPHVSVWGVQRKRWCSRRRSETPQTSFSVRHHGRDWRTEGENDSD